MRNLKVSNEDALAHGEWTKLMEITGEGQW